MKIDTKLKKSITIPLFCWSIMGIIFFVEKTFDLNFSYLGVLPISKIGLIGILTMPLVHGGLEHLMANSLPFIFLSSLLFYFYPKIAFKMFISIWSFTGVFIWLAGRDSYHIGASGLVYGFAAFLFLAGILSKEKGLAAITLLVCFLYGSLIWGVLPVKNEMSWEGHLGGLLVGLTLALIYKKSYSNPIVEIIEKETYQLFEYQNNSLNLKIKYTYKE